MEFGQSYCRDILIRILRKFILNFYDFYSIYYGFWKFIRIFL
jgi:hypothetical protein